MISILRILGLSGGSISGWVITCYYDPINFDLRAAAGEDLHE